MKYFVSLLLVLLPLGCSDNPVSAPVPNSDFFPLEEGNWWNYSGSYYMHIEVRGTTKIERNTFFIVVRTYTSSADTLFLRYSSRDRLMIYFDGTEYLFADFSLNTGSVWDSYYNFYGQIRKKGLSSSVPAGSFSDVTEILFDNRLFSDVYEFIQYAPGTGMISSTGFRRYTQLVSARVNGFTYP